MEPKNKLTKKEDYSPNFRANLACRRLLVHQLWPCIKQIVLEFLKNIHSPEFRSMKQGNANTRVFTRLDTVCQNGFE